MTPPLKPCPSRAAYLRGCRCEPCTNANREYGINQRNNPSPRPRTTARTHTETIQEIEHLLMCGEGEHAILKATTYTPNTLRTILQKAGRNDLIPRIFNGDQRMVWAA